MDNIKVIAAIYDVETTDIMLVRDMYAVQCAHYPPPSVFSDDGDLYQPCKAYINILVLEEVYAGPVSNMRCIGYASKCSCGRVYYKEVPNG